MQAMPLLYALPITLAVTLLVVEVIVPALLHEHHHHPHPHQDRGRRGRQRRRRPVLVQASTREEEQEEGGVSTGVATRSEDYGYEIRKRRPAANRRHQHQQVRAQRSRRALWSLPNTHLCLSLSLQNRHEEEEEELHVLGEVTASEYELAGRVDNEDTSQKLAPPVVLPPHPPGSLLPARPSSTTATRGGETEDQRPLLLFEEEEELAATGGGGKGGGSAAPILEPSSSFMEDPVDFERGQMAANSEAAPSSSVVPVSLGPPAAADRHRDRDREQSSSFPTDPPPAYGIKDTGSSPLHPQAAAAAATTTTTTRSAIPSSDHPNRATSFAFITAALPTAANTPPLPSSPSSPLMVNPEIGSETGFSSPELVFMSRDASQIGSVAGSGAGGEEATSEDDASSWTRVSSPCGFTSLSSDDDDDEDDDAGDLSAQAAPL